MAVYAQGAPSYPSPTFQNLTVLGTTNQPNVAITGGTISGVSSFSQSLTGNAATIGTSVKPFQINIGPITGQYPANSVPSMIQYNCYGNPDASLTGDGPTCLSVNNTTTDGAQKPNLAAMFGASIAPGTGLLPGANSFLGAAEFRATANAPMGSTSTASPIGQIASIVTYALAAPGAGALANVWTEEADFQVQYGAFSANEAGKGLIRLGNDWGTVGYNDGGSGRSSLVVAGQTPVCDFTSPASALASCGQHLPGFDWIFRVNTSSGESIMDTNTTVIGSTYQTAPNTNSCTDCGAGATGSPPHGGAAIAAPIIKSLLTGNVVDFHNVHVINNAWWTNGFQVTGTGTVNVGAGSIIPHTGGNGLTIDVPGVWASAVVVNPTYTVPKAVGTQIFDNFGGIYQVATVDVSGNVLTVTPVVPSYSPSASPSCTTACLAFGAGAPIRLNYTWTAESTLNLNPTGGTVQGPGGVFMNSGYGLRVNSTGISVGSADFLAATAGHGYYTTDTAGHKPFIGGAADATVMNGVDSSGAVTTVWSYANNAVGVQPFRVLKPLQPESYIAPVGTNPTVTACGTSPAVAGSSTDVSGAITVGTGTVTACTLTLAVTHARAPLCVANLNLASVPALITQTATSTTAVTFSSAANMATGQIYYHCM